MTIHKLYAKSRQILEFPAFGTGQAEFWEAGLWHASKGAGGTSKQGLAFQGYSCCSQDTKRKMLMLRSLQTPSAHSVGMSQRHVISLSEVQMKPPILVSSWNATIIFDD